MRVGLVLVVGAETDPLALVERCRAATTQPVHWYMAADVTQRARLAGLAAQRTCTLWLHASPPSVATARNEAILAAAADGCEATILLDAEASFRSGGLDLLIATMLQQEAPGLVLCQPPEGEEEISGRSCLALGSAAYNWVGAFDENICSADLGLADYLLRARQSGVPVLKQPNVLAQVGSPDDATVAIAAERRYFESKWGGAPGAQTRSRPFGSAGCRIDWSARANPYGEHDLPRRPAAERPMILTARRAACATPAVAERLEPGPVQQAVLHATIRAVYLALLQREPDPAALVLYSDRLSRGTTSLAELCEVIRTSDECRKLAAIGASSDGTRAA